MNGWSWLGVALAALFIADGFKMRRRLSALPTLEPASPKDPGRYTLLLAPGVELDSAGRGAAIAFAEAKGLLVLDLVPQQWSAFQAMGLSQLVDPATYQSARIAPGQTAWQAMLVERSLLQTACGSHEPPTDALGLTRLARKLKRYAPQGCGLAIAPGLRAAKLSAADRFAVQREIFLVLTPPVLAGQLALLLLTLAAAWLGGRLGLAALIAYQLQPALALAGSPIRARALFLVVLFALPLQLWEWMTAVFSARPDAERLEQSHSLRPLYRDALKEGASSFLEPRRESCYVCGSARLTVARRMPDLIQHKPGSFVVERCRDCGHLFQNPRLSLKGLSYYYRDFYDGLGESWLEAVFGLAPESYKARALLASDAQPKSWLDVGGGYGHFCLAAREVLPTTRFDCLDMSESVLESVRRGWADRGHRGMLPELAPELAGQYEVVSMSHCLEHTREPREELAAAFKVLSPEGLLLIEVPDPECVLRHLLRSRWLPYFQPQHQHLLSVSNLCRLLEEQGFRIERIQRGEAHVTGDFFFAVFLTLDRLAPQPDLPWLKEGGRIWNALVWGLGMPALLLALVIDGVANALRMVPGVSNAYRVLARRPKDTGAVTS
jgi:2-polyprenyl-3-methyl-5-hydroxy-6-metoxy-1,4-benzoquinol methylase